MLNYTERRCVECVVVPAVLAAIPAGKYLANAVVAAIKSTRTK